MSIYDQQKEFGAGFGLQDPQTGQAVTKENIEAVDAALREAYRILTECAASLNAGGTQVSRTFYVGGAAKLDNLIQRDYTARYRRKSVQGVEYFIETSLTLRSVGGENIVMEKNTPPQIQSLRDFLWERNLRFECREMKNDRGFLERAVFTITSEVPASATFTGDWSTGKIKLVVKNIDRLGPVDYTYDPPEINHALFEEFLKLLTAQPNNFQNLGKHQESMRVPPRPRAVPKETVYPELAPTSAAEPEPEQKSGLFGALKSLFKR